MATPRTIQRRQNGAVLPVLLLLALLLAGGGYNYWRNLRAEPPRPYASYGDAQIAELIEAYESEVRARQRGMPSPRRDAAGPGGALIAERIADFEAAQRHGNAYREALAGLAGRESVLRELRAEQQRRAGGPWAIHLRRLTTL